MLTQKQRILLELIHKKQKETGVSPSFEEMKDALSLKSKSGIHRLIAALEERGFIRRLPHKARAIEILRLPPDMAGSQPPQQAPPQKPNNVVQFESPSPAVVNIPLMGRIAAGSPIEAIEVRQDDVTVPAGMVGPGDHFALTVDGQSMIDRGIQDGDTVIIQKCNTARDGEIVVALVKDEEATLKILKRDGQNIKLIAANEEFDDQIYPASDVQVQGKMVGLFRQFH